ncbi:hypothetical protein LXA43DRAFT_996881 [Ganoderma leucocontextum]|nr:hypothetical protein LXA43DRAFT_996881 [Ganoderma leucocontextum]
MASQSALDNAVSILLTTQTSSFAMLAFLVYDWLINLDEEIRCFWDFRKGRRHMIAALIYGLSRYLSIVVEILELQTVFLLSDMDVSSCKINFYMQAIVNMPLIFTPAVFSAIRVYALSQKNKAMATSTFILLFGPTFSITILNVMNKPGVLPSPFNCSIVQAPVSAVVSARIAGDLLALFVTWRKTYTAYSAQRGVLRGSSLMRVMLYNGAYSCLTLPALALLIHDHAIQGAFIFCIGTLCRCLPPFRCVLITLSYQTSSGAATYASIVTNPCVNPFLSIVLTCRFLLDLRQADRTANPPSSLMAVPSLNFEFVENGQNDSRRSLPAFIASMGSEVHTGLHFVDSIGGRLDSDMAYVNDSEQDPREDALQGDGER